MKTLPDPRERPWLTVAELAEWSGEGEKAIRAAIAAGQLPHLNVGRYVRIPTALLAAQLGITPQTQGDAAGSTPAASASILVLQEKTNGLQGTPPPAA